MAITVTAAAELVAGARVYPIDKSGKLRFYHGKITQGAAAGDDGSSGTICVIPHGRARFIPYLSRYKVSALGAARVMKVGHELYYPLTSAETTEAQNLTLFMSAIDVSGATDALWPTTAGIKYDVYSRSGITLTATITGGTIPAAATLEFLVAVIFE